MKKNRAWGIPQFLFINPMLMNADGDGGDGGDGGGTGDGGGGGGGEPEKTFTQADMDRVVGNTRRSMNGKIETLQATADKVAGLEATLQEMKDANELKDASVTEQAQILAQRAADQHQAKIDELNGRITTVESEKATALQGLIDFQTRTTIAQELGKAGMLGTAAKHAVPAMIADSEVTLADDGSIATIKLNGVMQADLTTAVAQFLADNTHFKAAPAGGSGSGTPNGGSGGDGKPVSEMTQQERWHSSQRA